MRPTLPIADAGLALLRDTRPPLIEHGNYFRDAGHPKIDIGSQGTTPVIIEENDDGTKGELLTCLAHLFGQKLNGVELNLVENIKVKNTFTSATSALFSGHLQGYSTAQVISLNLPASKTVEVPPFNVTFDFQALYRMSAPVTANFILSLSPPGGTVPWNVKSSNVLIYPKNTIIWARQQPDGSVVDLRATIGVFVTPHDQSHAIDRLLKSASMFSSFGAMLGYQYMPKVETRASWKFTTAPGDCQFIHRSLTGGDTYTLASSSTCSTCTEDQGYTGVFSQTDWVSLGDASPPLALIQNLGEGTTTFKPEVTGDYVVAACNPYDATGTRIYEVALAPAFSAAHGAYDQVAAVYMALKQMGLTYVSVASDFFEGAQNIKYPAESLATTSANCIDGSLVFASALEAIGMRPAIIMLPGHAIAAVLMDPNGDPCNLNHWLPIETTLVSKSTPAEAVKVAIYEHLPKVTSIFAKGCPNMKTNQISTLFDIKTLREIGFLPAPM